MSSLPEAVRRLRPVRLAELDAVALPVRTDRKHLVPRTALPALLERLAPTHAVLEIAGRRWFAYDSVYFDTEDLEAARAHVQGRRRRFKCRSRAYLDTGGCWLELKEKGPRGETVKHRRPSSCEDFGVLTPAARAWVAQRLGRAPELAPVLRATYTRITLAGPDERVTLDIDLSYGSASLRPEWAIVETKAVRGARADAVLRSLGSRPVSLSKYVLGAGLTLMSAPPNDTRRLARRYFCRA